MKVYLYRRKGNTEYATCDRERYVALSQHRMFDTMVCYTEPPPAPVELTVWCDPMPESNGKTNFTAILMRKGVPFLEGITGGITIARSEYPDRVRYEADCMRYLIGELDEEPDMLAYDSDKHSGYVRPPADPDRCLKDALFACIEAGGADRSYGGVLTKDHRSAWVRFTTTEVD